MGTNSHVVVRQVKYIMRSHYVSRLASNELVNEIRTADGICFTPCIDGEQDVARGRNVAKPDGFTLVTGRYFYMYENEGKNQGQAHTIVSILIPSTSNDNFDSSTKSKIEKAVLGDCYYTDRVGVPCRRSIALCEYFDSSGFFAKNIHLKEALQSF